MNHVEIHPFSIATTKVGFGCSSLVGMVSPKEARELVDAAYDAGIRHFDVARSYGQGRAESVLGRALGSRRSNVTITSKFGLNVPSRPLLIDVSRAILRPIARRLRRVWSQARSVTGAMVETLDFSRRNAELSLDITLRELGTDYLDILLLHEASAEALNDPELLDFLEQSRQSRKIRGYGVGSKVQKLAALTTSHPEYCPIVQHEWSALSSDVPVPRSSFRITHGALAQSFAQLQDTFRKNPGLAKSASEAVGLDVSIPEHLSSLLLRGAALKYPDAVTLFSARSSERIHRNAEALENAELDASCLALLDYLAALALDLHRSFDFRPRTQ